MKYPGVPAGGSRTFTSAVWNT